MVRNLKVAVEDFSTGYDRKEVLHHLNFEVSKPGIYVVLGKNGAGKTTLFRAMTGMLRPFSGSVKYDDVKLEESDVEIAYLGHKNAIPTGMTVRSAMQFFGRIEGATREVIQDMIREFELENLLDRSVNNLSQGQRKRLALAKCLFGRKDVMILDEPTASLDPRVSAEIRSFMTKQSQSSTILYSSHNLYEATEIGNEVIALSDGKILYSGDMSGLSVGSYRIGVRGSGIEEVTTEFQKDGRYYVFDLKSPSEAAELISRLTSAGAKIYEVKDLSNPLERFFDESS